MRRSYMTSPSTPFLFFLTLCLWGFSLFSACETNSNKEPSHIDGGSYDIPAQHKAGWALYSKYCALCHGDRGQGYKADGANALNHPEFLRIASDTLLRNGIYRGRPGTPMSAWGATYGGPLSKEQTEQIVRLIRSWQTKPSIQVDTIKAKGEIKRGALQYAVHCATCHGDKGQGGTYMTLNNPEFLRDASDGFLRYSIAKGRPGTPMPGFENKLTPQAIDDLVLLIQSWKTDAPKPKPLPPRPLKPLMLHPKGAAPSFPQEGRFIPAADVKKAMDAGAGFILVDARPPADYVKKHILSAVSVPFYDVQKFIQKLPKEKWIVSYCACPHAESGIVYDALKKNGYTRIKVLNEGYIHWRDKGYPTKEGGHP